MTGKSDPDPPSAWERFVAATKQVLSVSKQELDKRDAAWRKKRVRRSRRRPT